MVGGSQRWLVVPNMVGGTVKMIDGIKNGWWYRTWLVVVKDGWWYRTWLVEP